MPADSHNAIGALPETRRRGPGTSRALTKGTTSYRANFSRTVFDPQHLADLAGYALLAWREDVVGEGTKLGSAMVRLPNVADVDLVVELHGNRYRLWAEAASDTPRRCRRRLEAALPTLCQLIARAIGGDTLGRLLRQRNDGGGA